MRAHWMMLAVGLGLVACNGRDDDTGDVVPPRPPTLSWEAPSDPLIDGQPFTLSVTAVDDDGVAAVYAYYRQRGERAWQSASEMAVDGDVWTVELPGEAVQAPGIELYFRGEDLRTTVGYLPERGPQAPFSVDVRRIGRALPYVEDFETLGGGRLRDIGWANRNLAFEGYDWAPTQVAARSGVVSVTHRRAPSNVQGAIDDWLVSPVLDLSSLPLAQVSWWEVGSDVALADHSLWISVGSPDPRDGEFVKIQDLEPPREGRWARARAVDLSEWAGQTGVTLAWSYRGVSADVWWIDDVAFEALGPDLVATGVSWTPEPLVPGGSGELILDVSNLTTVAAAGVEVEVVADQFVDFPAPVSIGAIAGGGAAEARIPLFVDPAAPENAWVGLTITFTDGTRTWEQTERMIVGSPTVARVRYRLEPAGEGDPEQLVRAFIGVGDPLEPVVELPIEGSLRRSGTFTVERDITDYYDFLPPRPGEDRWWVRFENGPRGELLEYSITFSGVAQPTTNLGPVTGFDRSVFWLPERPLPQLFTQSTSPNPVAPGSTVTWTPTFVNRGAPTAGPTTVTVRTDDPAITLTSSGPALLSGTGLLRNATASATFRFTVAPDRKSSLPAWFLATVSDDFESIVIPIDVAIPWPVLAVTGVVIDDWEGGDDDGLLDPGETARFDISVTNVGGLTTNGAVTCLLHQVSGTAAVSVDVPDGFFGVLAAGSTFNQKDFTVTVTAGALGDTLGFELRCADRSDTFIAPFEIVLGERPWIAMTSRPDPFRDNLKDYRFDVRDGRYRSDGANLELELRSWEPYGALTGLFIEAWGSSAGGDYNFYNIVANGETGSVRGYRTRFTALGPVTVTAEDETRVRITVPLAPLGLRTNQMSIGFGAGFCGGTAQYCDSYPDGWGAPYTGLITSRWTTLRW
jgi:hypothetical protein